MDRYEKLHAEYDALQQQKERRQIQAEAIENCVEALEELDLLEITFTDAHPRRRQIQENLNTPNKKASHPVQPIQV